MCAEFVVVKDFRLVGEHVLGAALHQSLIGFLIRPSLDLLAEKRPGEVERRFGVLDFLREENEHVAKGLLEAGAGERVEANKCESIRRKALAHDAHQGVTDRFRGPGVDAMGYNGVELAEGAVDRRQIKGSKVDVGDARARSHLARGRNRRLCKIDADEFGPGGPERHVDQVEAFAAADLQHARRAKRRDLTAVQRGKRTDHGRMGLNVDAGRIADAIV